MSSSAPYAYYPGCSGLGTSMEYEKSTRAVCKALGLELTEIPDWSCCGSTPAHTVDHVFSCALSARNLDLAEDLGAQAVTTPCPSCLTNLVTARHRMQKPAFKAEVDKLLEKPARSSLPVKSVLQVIAEDVGADTVKQRVMKPLEGLKIACYYGCIMNRPPELMQFDDCENPMAMDNLMAALGAEVVPFPLKVECCGASYGIARKDVVMRLSGKLLDAAGDIGAHAIATACPLCQMNLDMRQGQVNRATSRRHRMPVFYYTQLIGRALGLDDANLGFDKLCVSPSIAWQAMEEAQAAAAREAAEKAAKKAAKSTAKAS